MPTAKYKILIGIVGFVNDHKGIARSANAVLELNSDVALGEHTLFLRATADIKPNTEILLAYGAQSEFAPTKKRKRSLVGAKKWKAAKAEIPDAAGGVGGASQPAGVAVKTETAAA